MNPTPIATPRPTKPLSVEPDSDENQICLPEGVGSDAPEGEPTSFQVEGTVVTKDGKKYLTVTSVEGQPVPETESPQEDTQPDPEEEKEMMDTSSNDSLDKFMANKKAAQ